MTSESVSKWSDWSEWCLRRVAEWIENATGNTPEVISDHGKQNKQKECLRSNNNYVSITLLMHYIEDLVI
jgi:hypothetical protein